MLEFSPTILKLAPALLAAQRDMPAIVKDAENPHYKSTFASLDNIIAVVRPILNKHGFTLIQGAPELLTMETPHMMRVTSVLLHESGEWVASGVVIPIAKLDPQGAGQAVTYGRRYSLSPLLALATETDDDGNSASNIDPSEPRVSYRPAAGAVAGSAPRPSTASAPAVASAAASGRFRPRVPFGDKEPFDELSDVKLEKAMNWAISKGKYSDFVAAAQKELASRRGRGVESDHDFALGDIQVDDDLPF